jgi:hypothetical protein
MSAKHKLNASNFCGSLVVAGLVGWLTGSFAIFVVVLIALLVAGYHAGDLRW